MKRTIPLALLLAACGTETGNGLGPTLSIRAAQSPSGLLAREVAAPLFRGTDAQGTAITVAFARANVAKIEFDKPGSKPCAEADFADSGLSVHCDGAKIRVDGPILVDLMTGAAAPSLERLVVPPGTYKRIDVRFERSRAEGELKDLTLKASGELEYRQLPTPYDLALKFDEDARFESAGGIEVGEDAAEQVLLELDVSKWFSSLPLTACLDAGDLEIVGGRIPIVDKRGQCGAVEAALKDAIKGSSKLAKGVK